MLLTSEVKPNVWSLAVIQSMGFLRVLFVFERDVFILVPFEASSSVINSKLLNEPAISVVSMVSLKSETNVVYYQSILFCKEITIYSQNGMRYLTFHYSKMIGEITLWNPSRTVISKGMCMVICCSSCRHSSQPYETRLLRVWSTQVFGETF